jgi:hypothetical protein
MAAKGLGWYLDHYAHAHHVAISMRDSDPWKPDAVAVAIKARRDLVAHARRRGYKSPLLKPHRGSGEIG